MWTGSVLTTQYDLPGVRCQRSRYFAEVPGDRCGIAVAACACPATMMIAGAD
jgi:hypothetical protein